MDSINQNQPEQNRADLRGQEAIAKIKELVDKAQTCFFCTRAGNGEATGTRPMSVQQIDAAGHLWFLSADDSHKNQELAADSSVELFFQGSAHSDFLTLKGTATVTRDKRRSKSSGNRLLRRGSRKASTIPASPRLNSHLMKAITGTLNTVSRLPGSKWLSVRPSGRHSTTQSREPFTSSD